MGGGEGYVRQKYRFTVWRDTRRAVRWSNAGEHDSDAASLLSFMSAQQMTGQKAGVQLSKEGEAMNK